MGNPRLVDTLSGQAALLTELLATAMEPHLEGAGLTSSTFGLLTAIHAADGKVKQTELAQRLRVAQPTLSEALRQATARGLVQTEPWPGDRRAKSVRLTDVGRKAVAQALHALNRLENEVVQQLDSRELSTAITVLKSTNLRVAAQLRNRPDL